MALPAQKWKTYASNAIGRLRERWPQSLTFQELIEYSASNHVTPDEVEMVRKFLRINTNVDKKVFKETGKYKFYPKHGIAGPEDMLRVLRNKESYEGLKTVEMKEIWKEMEEDLNDLEKQHKIVVVRNKKDNLAKQVYLSNPSLYTHVDDEFRDIWLSVNIKDAQQMRNELAEVGFKVATEAPKVNAPAKVEKKKRGKKGGTKITNTHMAGLLKDYGHKRPAAAK